MEIYPTFASSAKIDKRQDYSALTLHKTRMKILLIIAHFILRDVNSSSVYCMDSAFPDEVLARWLKDVTSTRNDSSAVSQAHPSRSGRLT